MPTFFIVAGIFALLITAIVIVTLGLTWLFTVLMDWMPPAIAALIMLTISVMIVAALYMGITSVR